MRTCVTPQGRFRYKVHKPYYRVCNLRQRDHILSLGSPEEGPEVQNQANFPAGDLYVERASTVYEIPNAFPFRGSTFIDASWGDPRAENPSSIRVFPPKEVSLSQALDFWMQKQGIAHAGKKDLFQHLPSSILLALATTSTDPGDLVLLAHMACEFRYQESGGEPTGLAYKRAGGSSVPIVHDKDLFEAVGNNPYLPDKYKEIMLLRPGAQGPSEIVGDYLDQSQGTHVFEYLRRNSYIPWGHYASNMAHDAVRYRARDLSEGDMLGLRHLYYQRTYVRLAEELGLDHPGTSLSRDDLESLRQRILSAIEARDRKPGFTCSLWGWNFGFDFAPTRYKLHGSHQQIHQQHALVPAEAQAAENGEIMDENADAFACGDMVAEVVERYFQETGQDFFRDLVRCIRSNRRTDGRQGEDSLIVYQDLRVMLFVPKAQMSQWELQLMPLDSVGDILEADTECREALDRAMLVGVRVLEEMGAKMVTSIEYSKRFHVRSSQRLLYSLLPKLPWSPGSFSEAQHRFISSHYPEDFAAACRRHLDNACQDVL